MQERESNEFVTNLRCVSITFYGAVSHISTTQNTYTEICACEMNAMHSFRMTFFERLQAVMNFQIPVIGRCGGFEMNLCLQSMDRVFLLPHTRSTAIAILNHNGHYLLIYFRLRFYVTRVRRQEIRKSSWVTSPAKHNLREWQKIKKTSQLWWSICDRAKSIRISDVYSSSASPLCATFSTKKKIFLNNWTGSRHDRVRLYGCLTHGELCLLSSIDPSVSLLVPMCRLDIRVDRMKKKICKYMGFFWRKKSGNSWSRAEKKMDALCRAAGKKFISAARRSVPCRPPIFRTPRRIAQPTSHFSGRCRAYWKK